MLSISLPGMCAASIGMGATAKILGTDFPPQMSGDWVNRMSISSPLAIHLLRHSDDACSH